MPDRIKTFCWYKHFMLPQLAGIRHFFGYSLTPAGVRAQNVMVVSSSVFANTYFSGVIVHSLATLLYSPSNVAFLRYWGNRDCPSDNVVQSEETSELQIENVAGVFFIIVGGIILATIIGLCEKFFSMIRGSLNSVSNFVDMGTSTVVYNLKRRSYEYWHVDYMLDTASVFLQTFSWL